EPLVSLKSAAPPMAVSRLACTVLNSAPAPTAVLSWPFMLLLSEDHPTAVLLTPVVRLNRAFCPSAVLLPGYPPSGGGLTACTAGKRPKQMSMDATNGLKIFMM